MELIQHVIRHGSYLHMSVHEVASMDTAAILSVMHRSPYADELRRSSCGSSCLERAAFALAAEGSVRLGWCEWTVWS